MSAPHIRVVESLSAPYKMQPRICTMRKISFALLALLMGALTANADSLVIVRPAGTDSVYWSQLGPDQTPIPSPFSFTTTNGVSGTGSYANPAYSEQAFTDWSGEVGGIMQQGLDFGGNFSKGDFLNWTENSGALTLTFTQGYSQIGAQISSSDWYNFTAQICDVNGCFTENGYSADTNDNSAIYIGIESSSPISWVTFSLTDTAYPNDLGDFAINEVTLDSPETAVTPEPGSLLLFGTGLVGFAGALRRRFAR
jgi:hypothetical protein